MTSTLQRLIDALRDELQQHGEVLAWLDEAALRSLEPNASHGDAVQYHIGPLLDLRARRETLQHQFAWACQRPDVLTPAELLSLAGDDVRPLLRALFEEIDSLHQQLESSARRHPWLALSPFTTRLMAMGPPGLAAAHPSHPANLIVLGALSA